MLLQNMMYNDSYCRDCLYSLREQIHMLIYKKSETIYLICTEILRLLLFSDNNQSKRCHLDRRSDDICLKSKLWIVWAWEIWLSLKHEIWKSDENQNRLQISEHAESI